MSRLLRRRRAYRCWPRWHRIDRWTQAEIEAIRERARHYDVLFQVAP